MYYGAGCCGKVTCEQKQKGKNVSRRSRRAAVRAVVICLRRAQEGGALQRRRQARPDWGESVRNGREGGGAGESEGAHRAIRTKEGHAAALGALVLNRRSGAWQQDWGPRNGAIGCTPKLSRIALNYWHITTL